MSIHDPKTAKSIKRHLDDAASIRVAAKKSVKCREFTITPNEEWVVEPHNFRGVLSTTGGSEYRLGGSWVSSDLFATLGPAYPHDTNECPGPECPSFGEAFDMNIGMEE